jgi:hypothetical protein
MQRCYNPGHDAYHRYGGRGIDVCPQWHDVTQFIRWIEQNLGSRPEGMTLDRWPDNNGDYEPGNVRWADRFQQAENSRERSYGFGSELAAAVLTEAIVGECRRRYRAGEKQKDLAAEFGVSNPTMHKAVTGKTWRHVDA